MCTAGRRSLLALIFLAAVTLSGCASLETSQSTPTVDIKDTTRKEVLDLLVGELTKSGMQLKSMTDYTAVFEKPDTSFSGQLFFGSRYNSTPNMRVTFTTVERAQNVTVFAMPAMVTNPGSGHERATEVTNNNVRREIQDFLYRLRDRLQQ